MTHEIRIGKIIYLDDETFQCFFLIILLNITKVVLT